MLIRFGRYFCSTQFNNKTAYGILQVERNATPEEIKGKYYELAQKYHPDKAPQNTEIFKQINEAYQILKDPNRVLMA